MSAKNESDNEESAPLVLYHTVGSSFCQRVLMTLHEKRLDFDTCEIDLFECEHLEPSFIEINPKAEVPVLVHGNKKIAESYKIMQYLDENFPSKGGSHLFPTDIPQRARAKKMMKLIEKISLPAISFGTVIHSYIATNSLMTEYEKQKRSKVIKHSVGKMDSFITSHPEHEELYNQKKEKLNSFVHLISDIKEFKAILHNIKETLNEIEKEMPEAGSWLCGKEFSAPDICFAVTLRRIEFVGLTSWFFPPDDYPKIVQYYEQVQKRKCFLDTLDHDYEDDEAASSMCKYTTLFTTIGIIVFAIGVVCAHLKNH